MAIPTSKLRIEIVQETINDLSRNQELVARGNDSIATRLVWFVALAGFALLNLPSLAGKLAGRELPSLALLVLLIPWTLTALAGVISHILLGSVSYRNTLYFAGKRAHLDVFRMTRAQDASYEEFMEIVEDRLPDLASFKARLDMADRWATFAEFTTYTSLCFSFVWSIVWPILTT